MDERGSDEAFDSQGTDNETRPIMPQTFGQRLRGEALSLPGDFRGVAGRVIIYILSSSFIFEGLKSAGISETTSADVTLGAIAGGMIAGEFYFMKRLARRFPWLKVSYLDKDKFKDEDI